MKHTSYQSVERLLVIWLRIYSLCCRRRHRKHWNLWATYGWRNWGLPETPHRLLVECRYIQRVWESNDSLAWHTGDTPWWSSVAV